MLGFLVRLAISFHQAVTIRLPSNKMMPKICSDFKNKYDSVIVQSLNKELEAHAKQTLGLDYGETTADGAITLEPVYCLGNCACSPSVRINNDIYARVDAERFDDLMADIKAPVGEPK